MLRLKRPKRSREGGLEGDMSRLFKHFESKISQSGRITSRGLQPMLGKRGKMGRSDLYRHSPPFIRKFVSIISTASLGNSWLHFLRHCACFLGLLLNFWYHCHIEGPLRLSRRLSRLPHLNGSQPQRPPHPTTGDKHCTLTANMVRG